MISSLPIHIDRITMDTISQTGGAAGTTVTREDKVKQILDEIIEKLPEEFNMVEIMNKVEERTPYVIAIAIAIHIRNHSSVINVYSKKNFPHFSVGISLLRSKNASV